ncbi:hypothetical protein [Glycomyces albidus]|uniref:hypothetical protein n=1 Tax=Glycomyces albidus TaxID=2656774 RepID=UPI0018847DE2|nr:hypothetical protein [Glycomyces albidus]
MILKGSLSLYAAQGFWNKYFMPVPAGLLCGSAFAVVVLFAAHDSDDSAPVAGVNL